MDSKEQDPDVVADEEDDIGEAGRAIEGTVIHHFQKLQDGRDQSQRCSHISTNSPLSTNHIVLLIKHAGHVDSNGQNGVS